MARGPAGDRARGWRTDAIAAVVVAALALALALGAGLAAADVPSDAGLPQGLRDPANVVNQQAGQPLLDNDLTPYAKPDSQTWKQVAGAAYPSQTVIPGSPT